MMCKLHAANAKYIRQEKRAEHERGVAVCRGSVITFVM